MRHRLPIKGLAVLSVLTLVATAGVEAQTKRVAPNPSSAYEKLSLGNQKVAAALYQAQTPGVGTTARSLSLEQIATKRRSGQEWGQIFRELKQQGLVHEKTLGQVVTRYLRTTDTAPSVVSNDGGGGSGYASGAANGIGKGGK
jgi:hypothetical protein